MPISAGSAPAPASAAAIAGERVARPTPCGRTASARHASPMISPRIRAPRARAPSSDSSTTKPAPSPRTSLPAPASRNVSTTNRGGSSAPPARHASMRPARTAAAPRAIASSPATVGMLSVSERSLAETAIAVVAAIVFMTVCGNRSAERPGIPRWR